MEQVLNIRKYNVAGLLKLQAWGSDLNFKMLKLYKMWNLVYIVVLYQNQ